MKHFLFILLVIKVFDSKAQEKVAIYSDTLYKGQYGYFKTLEIFEDSTFIYKEETDWTNEIWVCQYALIREFSIKGKVKITDNSFYLLEGSDSKIESGVPICHVIKDRKLNTTREKVKIKIHSSRIYTYNEKPFPIENKMNRTLKRIW